MHIMSIRINSFIYSIRLIISSKRMRLVAISTCWSTTSILSRFSSLTTHLRSAGALVGDVCTTASVPRLSATVDRSITIRLGKWLFVLTWLVYTWADFLLEVVLPLEVFILRAHGGGVGVPLLRGRPSCGVLVSLVTGLRQGRRSSLTPVVRRHV